MTSHLFSKGRSQPPIHPPPIQPPKSAVAKSLPNTNKPSFIPYPDPIPAHYETPHPHVTVEAIGTAHIPSLTRITGLLLPIRYPNSFYTATITDPVIASLSRVAIYHDHPVVSTTNITNAISSKGTDKVIGGIRCRLEEIPGGQETNLYIQTLHLLSPYRGHGVAAALLNSLLFQTPPKSKTPSRISKLVKHYRIRSVTAHVHEANEDGLRWYIARGFKVQDGVVEGYYRRLTPSGARIVTLDVDWQQDGQSNSVESATIQNESSQSTNRSDPDDGGWEKIEAKDGDEGDHGVQLLPDSQSFESDDTPSRKRKAEDDSEKENVSQRR
ncbi:uncharacterized protein N7469_000613 [Penicillium citrinum]|uniref:N-acetyltransferase domain-containing protein n=2 Tax=Penicillium TaxID=5073 RepID=A0A9W9PD71_PENCI|nr:uncharacterized protein N7469_000613 [Penicillium citrinum]KAJ5242286.1 hypothetical protein N7469_000613 [Penicillium citrinum]KAJ5600224.1 hypothetical protein N7450_001291 [Penicillium hetheringtonii]KAK5807044.1 hypothetical protein VI817_001302 [Penicillium citrinum]